MANSNHLVEKTINTVEAFIGRFLRVHRDQVQLPDGKMAYREYIKHPGAAMVIPVLEDGRVVMVRQYRHALKKIFLEFPAGKIDSGEDTLQTAKRELLEETGYSASQMIWLTTIHPVIGYADERIEIYLAKDLKAGSQKLDEGEHLDVESHELSELVQLVRDNQITDVKTQIGVFWLQQIQNKNWSI